MPSRPTWVPWDGPDHAPRESVSFGEALRAPFRSTDGAKTILVGTVLGIVPILGPIALAGWAAEIAQRAARTPTLPMPALRFDDLMYWVRRGLTAFLHQLVTGMIGVLAIFVISGMGALLGLPFVTEDNYVAMLLGGFAGMMMGFFGLFLATPYLTMSLHLAETEGDVRAGFAWGKVRRLTGPILLSALGAFFALSVMWMMIALPLVFTFVGVYVMVPVITACWGHVRGQLYAVSRTRGSDVVLVCNQPPSPSELAERGYAPNP